MTNHLQFSPDQCRELYESKPYGIIDPAGHPPEGDALVTCRMALPPSVIDAMATWEVDVLKAIHSDQHHYNTFHTDMPNSLTCKLRMAGAFNVCIRPDGEPVVHYERAWGAPSLNSLILDHADWVIEYYDD